MKLFSSRSTPEARITPPPGTGHGVNAWFAAFQKPILDRHLMTVVAFLFAAVAVGEAVALIQVSENSGPKPYFVERDKQTGAVYYSEKYAEAFTPTADNNAYFLRLWATRVFTINLDAQDTLKRQIPLASKWTSGAATKALETYTTETDPVAKRVVSTPGLTRQVEENSTSFSADGHIAYMIVTLTESIAGARQTPTQKLLTINFLTAPQQLRPEDKKDNPIGMRITGLSITPYTGITPGSTK
ncbi:type IV secretion system protein [Ralstonia pickettii]|nr:type IV secretion system protein [Ralstonia pickettii]